MGLPAVVQSAPITDGVTYSTAQTVTFGAGVTVGSTVLVLGFTANPNAASLAAVTASVSMTGAVFIRRADISLRYEGNRGVTVWQADNVAAGATAITITPSLADALNYSAFTAVEVSGCHPDVVFETVVGADAEQTFSLPIGPAPASGSISQADTMAVVIQLINDSNNRTNPGWQTPSGWTVLRSSNISSEGYRPIWVGYKTQTTTSAVSATLASTESDLYGRCGALILLRGTTGSPSPPPPAPTPSPSPPPPGPAPAPPPPGPAPAPAAKAFKFTNVDPTLAGTVTDVVIQIHAAATTEPLFGTFIQGATAQAFVADGTKSAVIVNHNGTVAVTTGQTVKAIAQNAGGTAGFRGVATGIVVDL